MMAKVASLQQLSLIASQSPVSPEMKSGAPQRRLLWQEREGAHLQRSGGTIISDEVMRSHIA